MLDVNGIKNNYAVKASNKKGKIMSVSLRWPSKKAAVVFLPLAFLLTSCASLDGPSSDTPKAIDADKALAVNAASLATEDEATDAFKESQAVKYRGTDKVVNELPKVEPIRYVGDAVTMSFENAPLSEVTHAILSDILGIDYLVDGPIPGEVTFRTRTPIERDTLLNVLESLLKANNVMLIRGRDNRYIVSSAQSATQLAPRIVSKSDKAAGYSTMVIPLQYISAGGMADILKPLADEKAFTRVDNARNLLMLSGTQSQLGGWLDIINTFDVDMLEGMSVGLFPLQYSGVEELVDSLNKLLTAASTDDGQGGLTDIVRVMPFVRLNSVLVITPRAHYLERIETWIERLDRAPESGAERRLYVYPVQNTTAGRLATLLNSIYSGSGQGNNQQNTRNDRSVAPGLNRESIGSGAGFGNNGNRNNGNRNGLGNGNGAAQTSVSALTMDQEGSANAASEVRVVADEENNSLMIYSTGMQFKAIKEALTQLDTPPTQVLVEASIVEVTLSDSLKYGLEWTFNGQLGNSRFDGTGVLSDGAFNFGGGSGPLAELANGFSYTVTGGAGDIVAVLQALATESLINVISTPSVKVLDNNTATIQVGDQVPVNNGSTVTNGGNTIQNISYKDTGVQLSVRPSVNAGGLVTMDVEQTVTDVGQIDVTGNRRFLERSITSRVAVRSGESVVLGGLIRENAANQDDGIPWLHKAPLIGPLFGTTEKTRDRTELLVIITPRALFNDAEVSQVSDEMRDQVRNLELIDGKAN